MLNYGSLFVRKISSGLAISVDLESSCWPYMVKDYLFFSSVRVRPGSGAGVMNIGRKEQSVGASLAPMKKIGILDHVWPANLH